jgi:hypothetical protein
MDLDVKMPMHVKLIQIKLGYVRLGLPQNGVDHRYGYEVALLEKPIDGNGRFLWLWGEEDGCGFVRM